MKEIRERAKLDVSGLTSITRDELRLERRKEFATEGLRYYDLKRWKLFEKVMPNVKSPAGTPVFNPYFYEWPFPQWEIDRNPNLVQK